MALNSSNFKEKARECYKLVYGKNIYKKVEKINLNEFIFDPIQLAENGNRMAEDRKYMIAMNTNRTPQFIEYTSMKVLSKEVYSLTVAGNTRTGKSVNATGLTLFIHALENNLLPQTKKECTKWVDTYICANQLEHAEKIKKLPDKSEGKVYLVDETLESERRFGSGSTAIEVNLQDQANIIAVLRLHTVSISPRFFVLTQNPQYGLKTYGKLISDTYAFNRCLLYDLGNPLKDAMGFVIFPVYFVTNEEPWVRWINEAYEKKKIQWVKREKKQDTNYLMKMRFDMVEKVLEHPIFSKAKNKNQKMAVIKSLIGKQPNTVYEEIYQLTRDLDFLEQVKEL